MMRYWRIPFVAVLGFLAVILATVYSPDSVIIRNIIVGVATAIFAIWTLSEWNARWTNRPVVSLLVLVVYGGLCGLLSYYIGN